MDTSVNVTNILWKRYNESNDVKERHPGCSALPGARPLFAFASSAISENNSSRAKQEYLGTHDVSVSAHTVRSRVLEKGLLQRRPLRVPRLLLGNPTARLAWAMNVNWSPGDWNHIIFSDESRFYYIQFLEEYISGNNLETKQGYNMLVRILEEVQ